MNTDTLIIRYGEICLKGKNRGDFERWLKKDIENHFQRRGYPFEEILLQRGRIYVRGTGAVTDLHKVMGVLSYSPAWEIEPDYDSLHSAVLGILPLIRGKKSFRISCQRTDKRFSPDSPSIEREIGALVHERSGIPVNLEKPDVNIQIEITARSIHLFFEKLPGYGGFPYGSAGRLVSLFSSGIDSPVATFLMMKRGTEPVLLHFLINPEDAGERSKIESLRECLQEYTSGRSIKLHLIPRDDIFKGEFNRLYHSRYHSYICLMCKYLMHRKAAEIAEQEGALGVITGDNLCQVASQTLQNLHAQRGWQPYPVYSPLIAFEKTETMALARRIGTYDLSISREKGCTPPDSPKTRVSKERLETILHECGLLE